MMRIDTDQADDGATLRVAGRLCGACVAALEECWQAARARFPAKTPSVDLTEVTSIDKAGWCLLRLMYRDGVKFSAKGLATETILEGLKEQDTVARTGEKGA